MEFYIFCELSAFLIDMFNAMNFLSTMLFVEAQELRCIFIFFFSSIFCGLVFNETSSFDPYFKVRCLVSKHLKIFLLSFSYCLLV